MHFVVSVPLKQAISLENAAEFTSEFTDDQDHATQRSVLLENALLATKTFQGHHDIEVQTVRFEPCDLNGHAIVRTVSANSGQAI